MALSAYDPIAQAFAPSLALPVEPGSLTSDDLNRAIADGVARAVTLALAQIVSGGGTTTTPATGISNDLGVSFTDDLGVSLTADALIPDLAASAASSGLVDDFGIPLF